MMKKRQRQEIKMNKAQVSFTILQTIPRLIFLIIVLFSVIYLVRGYVADNLNVQKVQAEVFVNRIIYSPNGISYYDKELETTTPSLIDPKLLTNANLENLMNYKDDTFIAGKVILFDIQDKQIASAIYNEKAYNRWTPLIGQEGIGGVTQFKKSVLVTFINEGKIRQGMLKFEVLMPGS